MVIIVDSIDRVGKTTLCNKLAEKVNGKIYKCELNAIGKSRRAKDFTEATVDSEIGPMLGMLNICNMFSENIIIFDRFHMSDYVYGILQRNYDKEKALDHVDWIDSVLVEMGNDVILIKVNPTDINRSSREHGYDLSKHYELFNVLYNRSKIANKYECTYNTMDEVIEQVSEQIKKNLGK